MLVFGRVDIYIYMYNIFLFVYAYIYIFIQIHISYIYIIICLIHPFSIHHLMDMSCLAACQGARTETAERDHGWWP